MGTMEFCTDDILFPLPDAATAHHFFVMRFDRGLAIGRSLCDDADPMEKRLLVAAGAPKFKNAGFGVALAPHCDALKLNAGTAGVVVVAPNLNSPCGAAALAWAVLLEMPLLRPLATAPNWNPLG